MSSVEVAPLTETKPLEDGDLTSKNDELSSSPEADDEKMDQGKDGKKSPESARAPATGKNPWGKMKSQLCQGIVQNSGVLFYNKDTKYQEKYFVFSLLYFLFFVMKLVRLTAALIFQKRISLMLNRKPTDPKFKIRSKPMERYGVSYKF